ncbi:uncharacterized protein LOC143902124 [Temnothorax americanus]|uniref:uncharacterized protein LOC143902124 n=1 Tax=Temnothorax americanus TaxID=1964332 RepID=UPI004069076D
MKVKNAVINVLSMDNACFAWVLDLRDIEFPMTLSQIKQFERLNNISVNVYTIEGQKTSNVLPIRLTDRTSVKKHVNLLYVQDPRYNNVGHFAWIKNLSRVVSSQLSKHHGQKYICDRCLHYFSSSDKLQSHTVDCRKVNDCAIKLPSEDNKWLFFKNHSRKKRLPFVVYADLECVLQKTQPETEHASYAYQHHRVCSIAYYVQCSYDETLSAYRFRRDNDCVAWFVEELKGLAHCVKNISFDIVCMVDLTQDEWETFHSAAQCHICEKPFAPNDNRVRDHCHLIGRYRGPTHSTCNLNYKDSHFIPVIFYNLSGYDAHFIIKEIAAAFEGKIDVLPITKENCVASYGLDPAYYYTLPGFTWDAMLKHTCVNFELLTDIDMVMFIERGIRGGLSQCSGRYAQANNKYMQSYDSSKPSSYLMYFDVNNLYGWAMCKPLPYAEFRWVEDVSNFDFSAIALDSPTGYILEVDLEYPQDKHDAHTDLPFCPTRDKPPGKRQDKLLATLHDKKLFGKTIENVCNHVDVKLLTKWDERYDAEAMIARPNFHSRSVFSENLIAVELRKLEVKFDKPIYVGMCILDLSKVCLYEFHHKYMSPLYRDSCRIMYTDSDSLIYHTKCDDAYKNIKHDIVRFDTSDYAVDNAYSMPLVNKKVPGLMKDENNGAIMTEFVGLRAKMYALRIDGKKDCKKAKGVKSNVIARTIAFDDYTRCLNDEIEMTRPQSCIRSKMHEVYTIRETKIALSPYDDKRYIVPDSTDTLPWGHYRIPLS